MSHIDTRQIGRDSLLLLAEVRVGNAGACHPVKVRNLSAGGMMAEGNVDVARGALVTVELRNVGEVRGSVAWVQDSRFGIAFVEEVDPKQVRAPAGSPTSDLWSPRFTRPPLPTEERGTLRTI